MEFYISELTKHRALYFIAIIVIKIEFQEKKLI